jgi:hypothetical protein
MHDPWECHLAVVKCILCYVHGTTAYELHLLGTGVPKITAYSNAD